MTLAPKTDAPVGDSLGATLKLDGKAEAGVKVSIKADKPLFNPKANLLKFFLPDGVKLPKSWKLVNHGLNQSWKPVED
jgi:hypothetical protein